MWRDGADEFTSDSEGTIKVTRRWLHPLLGAVTLLNSAILALAIVLISPLYKVRFHVLPVDEVGPLIKYPHHYLWSSAQRESLRNSAVIWVYKRGTFIANQLLLEKWRDRIWISDSRILWQTSVIFNKLGLTSFTVEIGRDYPVGFPELPAREFQFLVPLTDSELSEASKQLAVLPLELRTGFVTLTVRDGAYKRVHRITPLANDVKEAYRNNNIEDFVVLCGEAQRAGLSLIRMGQAVERKFSNDVGACFDYASSGLRSELLDHYLMTQCQLCVTTSLGFDAIPGMAGIPRLVVNVVPYFVLSDHYAWDVVVPVRFFDSELQRELSMTESLQRRSIRAFRGSEEIAQDGLIIVRMTPQELADAFQDSLQFRNGKVSLTEDDRKLQMLFWDVLAGAIPIGNRPLDSRPLVSPSYLRRHRQWLL